MADLTRWRRGLVVLRLLLVGFAGGLILLSREQVVVPGWEALVAFVEQAAVVAESL